MFPDLTWKKYFPPGNGGGGGVGGVGGVGGGGGGGGGDGGGGGTISLFDKLIFLFLECCC